MLRFSYTSSLMPRRFARGAVRLAVVPRQAAVAASQVHTASDAAAKTGGDQPAISSDVYAPEKHVYDHSGREDRFPSTVHVPEG